MAFTPTKKGMPAFEKSGKDKEPKGMKEGSKREEAFDRKQMKGKLGDGMSKKSVQPAMSFKKK